MNSGLFAFAFDGKVDMHSINPLEMTNFEAAGMTAGIVAVIVTILWDLWTRKKMRGLDLDKEMIYTPEKLKDYKRGEKK